MKTIAGIYIFFLAGVLSACICFFTSCDVQKRHYRNGFYISEKNALVKINAQKAEDLNGEQIIPQKNKLVIAKEKNISPVLLPMREQHIPVSEKKSLPKNKKNFKLRRISAIHFGPADLKNKKAEPGSTDEVDFSEEQKIKNFSTASLIFGILAVLLLIIGIGILFGILAIVFGSLAINKQKKYPLPVPEVKLARAGKILGIVALCILPLVFLGLFLYALASIAGL